MTSVAWGAVVLAAIPSPSSNVLHLGPLTVHWYGVMYAVAVLAAILVTARRWERLGGDRALVYQVALWGFPAGIVGGRLYFLATSWNEVPDHWWGPVAVWQGGLGIWGGIAAGTLVGLLVLRRHGADIPRFLDAAAPGLLVLYVAGYSLGRIGEELVRVDPAHHILGFRLNFFVALLLFAAGMAWFAYTQGWPGRAHRPAAVLVAIALSAAALLGCGGGHAARGHTQAAGAGAWWISRAARTPDSSAPWIHACQSEQCSPAKCTRPSGLTMSACSTASWPGSKSAKAPTAYGSLYHA